MGLLAREDGDQTAIGSHVLERSAVLSSIRRLPREQGAPAADPLGTCARCGQGSVPVGEERTCRRGMRVHEEGNHEDVSVPEEMASVAAPAEPSSPDRGEVTLRISRRDEVIQREAKSTLRMGIALDNHVGIAPSPAPGLPVTSEEGRDTYALSLLEGPVGWSLWRSMTNHRDNCSYALNRAPLLL